jgi:hypothetical protein
MFLTLHANKIELACLSKRDLAHCWKAEAMDQEQRPARADSEGDKADAEKESSSSSIGDDPGCAQGTGDPKDRNSREAANQGTLRKGKWTVSCWCF